MSSFLNCHGVAPVTSLLLSSHALTSSHKLVSSCHEYTIFSDCAFVQHAFVLIRFLPMARFGKSEFSVSLFIFFLFFFFFDYFSSVSYGPVAKLLAFSSETPHLPRLQALLPSERLPSERLSRFDLRGICLPHNSFLFL